MNEINWKAPYLDRRTWLLDHLQELNVDCKEILVLLLIDYGNQVHANITHEWIREKIKLEIEEIEEIFMSLSDKGYLDIGLNEGNLEFDISGVFEVKDTNDEVLQRSLLEVFESEFRRTLSSSEMQRIINLSSKYDERRVRCALNEAVVYQKVNLNYIESILVSWMDKGLSIEDLENGIR